MVKLDSKFWPGCGKWDLQHTEAITYMRVFLELTKLGSGWCLCVKLHRRTCGVSFGFKLYPNIHSIRTTIKGRAMFLSPERCN